jgi:hypothetical protein
LTADQIYACARAAGFSPDQSVTMTAIALAESGGNADAHNPNGEDSRGLWQINVKAHPDLAHVDLYDPVENAKAAFRISGNGQNVSPWTTTHGKNAAYLAHQDDAIAAAHHAGDFDADGNWGGTQYGGILSAGDPGSGHEPNLDFVHELGSHDLDGVDGGHTGGPSAHDFVQLALSQAGDEYVFGAQAADQGHVLSDDPDAFDCQELVEWSAAKLGIEAKDASYMQYDELERTNHTMSVEDALKTPGALLFSTGANGKVHHVAISIGDGVHTIEAKGRAYGVGEFEAGNRFDKAGMLPGLDYSGTDGNGAEHLAPEVTLDGLLAELDPQSPDSDHDGLTDALENLLGTDAHAIDSDHDGLSDAYEIMTSHTDPTATDSDHDGLGDAREIAMGLDPLDHDSDHDGQADGHGLVAESGVDHDADGLDDALEHILGTSTSAVDSDHDGFSDALEYQAGFDAADHDSDPLRVDAGQEVGLEGLLADVVADHQPDDAHDFDDDLDPDP